MNDDSCGLAHAGGARSVEGVLAIVREALTRGTPTGDPWSHIEEFLADLETRTCIAHVSKARQQLRDLRASCPTLSLGEVNAWRAERLRAGRGRSTVNHYIGRARTYLRWCADAGLMPPHPLTLRKNIMLQVDEKDLMRKPRAFTDAEMDLFFNAVRKLDRALGGRQQEGVWRFLVETGLRWNEAAMLTRSHLSGDCISLPAAFAKNGKARKVGPLSPCLVAWLSAHPRDPALLMSRTGKSWREVGHRCAHTAFVRALARAGLMQYDADGRSLTIHSLRRTAGTRWMREGVPIEHVSRLLGHGSTAFTERVYIDLCAEDPVQAVRDARATRDAETKIREREKNRDGASAANSGFGEATPTRP